jgi:hypothetical protein
MNENPILPARIYIYFPPLFYPKIFPPPTYHLPLPSYLPSTSPLLPTTYLPPPTYHLPPTSPLLPTTYQPLPPSLHRQNSRDVEQERASSRGAWREAWRGAWSSELGAVSLEQGSGWSRNGT